MMIISPRGGNLNDSPKISVYSMSTSVIDEGTSDEAMDDVGKALIEKR